ncbi:hypothetical protein [Hymenobacter cellulosivorans]|uniref:Uncharacterized protein n=1 Tax=Hymenobacter cellulosivorans TaxID=2932249 RepID=A0ABY4FDM0_9BACT|nr:hypothetical protein [Hymenobacter cellulosivorans]UOQ54500.1 hypothetical protein MUN80_06990 [Hymenobacter cellulosivorans]
MLIPSGYARRFSLVVFLLTIPLLARADALSGLEIFFQLLAIVAGIALAGFVVTLLAYFRPQSRGLQILNYVLVGLNLLLGLLWEQLFSRSSDIPIFGEFNPFLSLAVPLAVWLGAVRLARREEKPLRRLLWVSVAVFATQLLLNPLVQHLVWSTVDRQAYISGGVFWLGRVVNLLVSFACWWAVLEQVQQQWQLGWQALRPRLLAPALEAGFGLVYSLGSVLLILESGARLADLGQYFVSLLTGTVLGWAVGALAIWLNQRRYDTRAEPEHEQV